MRIIFNLIKIIFIIFVVLIIVALIAAPPPVERVSQNTQTPQNTQEHELTEEQRAARNAALEERAQRAAEQARIQAENARVEAERQAERARIQAERQACAMDWTKCRDNEDIANNYNEISRIRSACQALANDMARFGTPVWPGFWSGGAFGSYVGGRRALETGLITMVEPDAQFQNGFGAMVRSRVYCDYNLRTHRIIDVRITPR